MSNSSESRDRAVARLTELSRRISESPVAPLRDALLVVLGEVLSLIFRLRAGRGQGTPHPLMQIVASQVGEPAESWDLTNPDSVRRESEESMAFLPARVRSRRSRHSIRTPAGDCEIVTLVPKERRWSLRERGGGSDALGRPVGVYLHGGGFVIGTADSVLPEADDFAVGLGTTMYVVNYPRAPETKLEEILTASVAAVEHAVGESPSGTFFIASESAGGYLAIAALLRKPELAERCRAVVLMYPLLDLTLSRPPTWRLGTGHILTRRLLEWFVAAVTGGPPSEAEAHRVFNQSRPDVMPPVMVLVGELDPLVEDWRDLTWVPDLSVRVVPGMMHGFMQFRRILPERDREMRMLVRHLRKVFAAGARAGQTKVVAGASRTESSDRRADAS